METQLFKLLSAASIRKVQGKYDISTYNKLYKRSKLIKDNIDRTAAKLLLAITATEEGIDIDNHRAQSQGQIPTISSSYH